MAITNSYGTRIIKILDSAHSASGSEGSSSTPIPNPANLIKAYGNITVVGGAVPNTEVTVGPPGASPEFETELRNGVFEIGDTFYNPRYSSYSTIVEVVNQTTLKLSDRVGFVGGSVMIFKRNTRPCNLYVTCKTNSAASANFNIMTELFDSITLTADTALPTGSVSQLIPLQAMFLRRTPVFTGTIHAIFN